MLTQRQRLAGLPQNLARRVKRTTQSLEQQHLDAAERGALAAFALASQHPEILRLLGTIRLLRGSPEQALALLSRACAQRPDDPLIFNALGGAYERLNDYAQALAALRRACELGPDLESCWSNYARVLYVSGEVDAAVSAWQRVLALAPRRVDARVMLADVLNSQGRTAEAETQYRDIIRENPVNAGHAWWGLATLRPMPLTAADIPSMRNSLQSATASEQHLIATGFALAHALERQGNYTEAFAALAQAHARARRMDPWNAADFTAQVDAVLAAFSGHSAKAAPPQGHEAIFITSMPRSGSTLTEQILASHPLVEGTSELPHIRQLVMEETSRRQQPFPRWVDEMGTSDWHILGKQYLARTEQRRQHRPRFTDKMPGNWLYTGVILAMLPQARVVVVRRERLETALACYRTLFTHQGYTHDIGDLAAHWRDFDRAVRRWRELYPDRVYELIYEDLVSDPEMQIRRLLAFCDLPFEESCLNFHATSRRISTPSAAQVREPIRQDTARAAEYGSLLDPLRAALGMPALQIP
jgi:tetratricopeptide (TPR) repeat protein